MWPIDYRTLVEELLKLEHQWMKGEDWLARGITYDDFCTGKDEGQQECAIQLRRLLEKTGMLQEPEDEE